ncbi:MAG: VanZ family protein [Chloroflexi bacterium]|nr:VanZ family protein [Chloroflexota bacterium]
MSIANPKSEIRNPKSQIQRWATVLAWMSLIFYLSAQPDLPNLTPGVPHLAEIGGHLTVYGVLAVLLWWALRGAGVRRSTAWALALTALYGASDELHQSFVPGRTMTAVDLAFDVVGAGLGLLAARWVCSLRGGLRPGGLLGRILRRLSRVV